MKRLSVYAVILLGFTASCGPAGTPAVPASGGVTRAASQSLPMRWDHRPEAREWTRSAMAAMGAQGAPLTALVPGDIKTWCPGYRRAPLQDRQAFWVGLLSTLAKYESTWNPQAVGGRSQWFGLVQIAPATARYFGCAVGSGAALKDGSANLSCAIRILAKTVPRDGVVAAGGKGAAADWAPFHNAAKRADMAAWTRAQSYCQ